MTPEQYIRYQAAMITGYTSGIGGSTWLYYAPPTGSGVTASPVFETASARTLYVVREKLVQYGQPLPPQPVGETRWRLIAPVDTNIRAGGLIVSGANAFFITTLDTDQGFPTGIVEKASAPAATVPKKSLRTGLRIGAW